MDIVYFIENNKKFTVYSFFTVHMYWFGALFMDINSAAGAGLKKKKKKRKESKTRFPNTPYM